MLLMHKNEATDFQWHIKCAMSNDDDAEGATSTPLPAGNEASEEGTASETPCEEG